MQLAHEHFCHSPIIFPPPKFLSILGRKLFGGSGRKQLGPTIYFPSSLTQSNTLQKSSSSHFLSKVFYPPYFNSKQTHPQSPTVAMLIWKPNHIILHKLYYYFHLNSNSNTWLNLIGYFQI